MNSPFTDFIEIATESFPDSSTELELNGPFSNGEAVADMEEESGLQGLDQYRSKINISKAIQANSFYEKKGTWGGMTRNNIISNFASNGIIKQCDTLDSTYFSLAVAKFQSLNRGLTVDGALGPASFSKLKGNTSSGKSRWHTFIKNTTLCEAEPFVYGKETYEAIVNAIRRTSRDKGHYIYILGWMLDINFPLNPNKPDTTMEALLKEAADKGVEIRVMIWNNFFYDKEITKALETLNGFGNTVVIRDDVTYGSPSLEVGLHLLRNTISAIPLPIRLVLDKMDIGPWEEIKKYSIAKNEGSHHEKVIIVKNEDGLIGFCGGIDINPDRIGGFENDGKTPMPITSFNEKGLPMKFTDRFFEDPQLEILHDVHCMVKGSGAYSLLQRFLWRWEHFKSVRSNINPLIYNKLEGKKETLKDLPQPFSSGKGISNVKILHTYNSKNGADYSRSIYNTVKTAIQNAEKSVHFECQYMISVEIAKLLHDKLAEKKRKNESFTVSILTQEDEFARDDIKNIKKMRKAFMDTLYGGPSRNDDRIKVWVLDKAAPFPAHHKVHSKLYIVDDELVIIGSANCSRRSMTYDSETAAVIFNDPGYTYDFVCSLREKYDKISYWKKYEPDAKIKDVDQELIEKVDKYLNDVSITSFIAGLLGGIGGKMVLTGAVRELASALPELLRPIEDPYDTRTKIEQEFTHLDNENAFETNNMFSVQAGGSFANETSSLVDYVFQDEPAPQEQHFYTGNGGDETDRFLNYHDQKETAFPFAHRFTEEDNLKYYNPGSNEDNFEATPDYENIVAEEMETGDSKTKKTCEGLICWAKTVLNKLLGLNLVLNNTLDEETKKIIADFQAKKNIPQSRTIDAVTERALLEANAIQEKGTTATHIIAEAKTKIEDWTKQGLSGVKNKAQFILNNYRDPRKLFAFVLHHMAFKRRGRTSNKYSDPTGYVNTGAHFCIMLDGRIIQLHPMSRMIWHGNCLSPRSVAVEFEGNFPNIKGKWWYPTDKKTGKKIKVNEDTPTQAQYDAGKFLASYLKTVLGTTHIMAHRQSSDSRENDPGPDIWYNVGQWAIDNLGMTDGGPASKCGTGNPILPEWRNWGNKTSSLVNKEYDEGEGEGGEEEIVWEDIDNESTYSDAEMIDESNPEQEDFLFEDNEILADTAKAIRLNRYYADKLGWSQYHDQINNLLLPYSGQQNVSLGEEAFAQAAAAWQQQQQGLSADGIIGPGTWAGMKSYLFPGSKATSSSTPSQTSIPKWVAELTPLLNKYRKDIPLDFLIGWIAVESYGNIKSHTSLDERGYFQLHPGESKTLKIVDHTRLSNDPEFSISSGIQLVNYLSGLAVQNLARLGLSKSSDLFWYIVKLYHWLPLGVQAITEVMQSNSFTPTNWDDYKTFVSSHVTSIKQVMIRVRGKAWDPLRGIENVEKLYRYAKQFSPAATTADSNEVETMHENYSSAYRLEKLKHWSYLLLYKVPDEIVRQLKARSMYVQYAHNESYSNELNADFYGLKILKYPTLNGVLMNAQSLITYIRLNINNLVDTSYCDFYPYSITIDTQKWISNDPLGAVLRLDIKGPDNASVVVSKFSSSGWRFSTIHTPETGDHPVSGHREFFIGKDSSGQEYFVVKGLDMMSTGVAGIGLPIFGELGFSQGDALWRSLRKKVSQFINANGGSAKEDITYSERVEWRYVYYEYKNALAATFGKGAGSSENSVFFDMQLEGYEN